MNLEGTVFLLAFLIGVGLWLYKLYNVINACGSYPPGVGWLVLVGFILSYGVALFMVLIDPTHATGVLLLLFSLLFLAMIPLQLAEVFYFLGKSYFFGVQAHKARGG
jgi:hypothetical protein